MDGIQHQNGRAKYRWGDTMSCVDSRLAFNGRSTSTCHTRNKCGFIILLQRFSNFSVSRAPASTGFWSPFEQMDRVKETVVKEAIDGKVLKRLSDDIIPHILNLYGSCATARDFEMYAPNATFEDPLMSAKGVNQIKSAFYSLGKIFGESKIVEYNIQENMVGPGKGEIAIDNKQHYKFLGRDVDLASLIKLDVEEGKIIRHEDWWDGKPLWDRNTVKLPLFGRILEMTRRGSMLATHAMMGFGKDPKP